MKHYDKMSKADLIKELREKEKLCSPAHELAAIVEFSDDAIIGKTPDGCITSWNRGAENIYGYSAGEIIGRNIMILSPPDRQDEVLQILEKIKRGELVEHFETVRFTKERKLIHVSLSVSPIIDKEGRTTGSAAIARDITGRKQADEALRKSEQRFRRLVDGNIIGVLVADSECILEANDVYLQMVGYSREELEGGKLRWSEMTPPEWAAADRKRTEELLTRGACTPYEKEYFRKDGSRVPIFIGASLLSLDPLSFICFVVDLSKLKQAEDELLRSHAELEKRVMARTEQLEKQRLKLKAQNQQLEETHHELEKSRDRYSDLYNFAPLGYVSLDGHGIIREINHTGADLLGVERPLLLDTPFISYVIEKDKRLLLDHLHRCRQTKGHVTTELSIRSKKDGLFHMQLYSVRVKDSESRGTLYRTAITDITENKKLEQQLLHTQKMESIGMLAGGVAHEFNNLLTAISGYGQILQESISIDDEMSQESIGNILKAAGRAAELTRGLLAFSRKQLINPELVFIDTITGHASKLIRMIIGADIEISTAFSGKNLRVKADVGQIEQVLMNLATNARDAMPHGGRLTISTEQVTVEDGSEAEYELSSPGNYALITVADTGAGIDEKLLGKIFEPFYTTKEVGKGTGLGLSIAHGIIKQHDGSILVSSEPSKGTTFNIYLPLTANSDVNEKPKMSAPLVGGMETLLVAEDEEIVKNYLKKILEKAGYNVAVTNNGEDAVAIFKEHHDISLVLSDVVMPKKNGKEMLDEIKKIKPGIKSVFISGYTADIMHRKGIIEEATEFIMKPFNKNVLLQKIREVLDKD
jgi:PAS domain S-box-containing protein